MSLVSLVKTVHNPSLQEVERALVQNLSLLGGLESLVHPGAKVLVKPNVGTVAARETGRNTDPMVVEALINLLFNAGAGQVTIAESSIVGVDTMVAFTSAGFTAVAERTGAKLTDLKQEEVVEKTVNDGLVFDKIRIFRPALEADLIINVPKLKTISAVPVSLGMKNLKGFLPDSEKKRFHYTDLNKAIVDLNIMLQPQLTIIDGIIGNQLYEPKETNVLIAGTDVVAVDTVGCMVMGVDPSMVAYLTLATERGLGTAARQEIRILGENLQAVKQQFTQAPSNAEAFKSQFSQVEIVDGAACSGCVATLYLSLKQAREKGLLDKWKGTTFAIGPKAEPVEGRRVLYLGKCLQRCQDKDYIPGCPFTFMEFVDYLENN